MPLIITDECVIELKNRALAFKEKNAKAQRTIVYSVPDKHLEYIQEAKSVREIIEN